MTFQKNEKWTELIWFLTVLHKYGAEITFKTKTTRAPKERLENVVGIKIWSWQTAQLEDRTSSATVPFFWFTSSR